jgi:hypothetical protein
MCFIVCSALKENSHELDIFLEATKLSTVSTFCLCAAGFQNFELLIVTLSRDPDASILVKKPIAESHL